MYPVRMPDCLRRRYTSTALKFNRRERLPMQYVTNSMLLQLISCVCVFFCYYHFASHMLVLHILFFSSPATTLYRKCFRMNPKFRVQSYKKLLNFIEIFTEKVQNRGKKCPKGGEAMVVCRGWVSHFGNWYYVTLPISQGKMRWLFTRIHSVHSTKPTVRTNVFKQTHGYSIDPFNFSQGNTPIGNGEKGNIFSWFSLLPSQDKATLTVEIS